MPLVEEILDTAPVNLRTIPVSVDRHTLARRRWRALAADGTDIAVDLDKPCGNGSVLFVTSDAVYITDQKPEAVVDIPLPKTSEAAARLGWFLGNQHLPVEITADTIRIEANLQLLEKLKREHIHFHPNKAVFSPAPHSAGHAHGGHRHVHAHA